MPAGAGAAWSNGEHAQGADFALCFLSACLVVDLSLLVVDVVLLVRSEAGSAWVTSHSYLDGFSVVQS